MISFAETLPFEAQWRYQSGQQQKWSRKIEVEEITDEPDHVDLPQDGSLKCTLCPFSNEDSLEFERHLMGHTPSDDSIYKCFYCKFFVSHKDEL